MSSSLSIKDIGIKVQSLLFTFLKKINPQNFQNWSEITSPDYFIQNGSFKKTEKKMNATWKQSMRSPGRTATHSDDSHGRERCLTCFRTLTHSSSSGPNPANRTSTSWNIQQDSIKFITTNFIFQYDKCYTWASWNSSRSSSELKQIFEETITRNNNQCLESILSNNLMLYMQRNWIKELPDHQSPNVYEIKS